MVQDQPREKESVRPHLSRKIWEWWHMPVIPVIVGSKDRKIVV
jgi:hypothetical protein